MLIIGLTGGIGMGKSAVAALLAGMGLPVYNADHAVHTLLQPGGKAVKRVAKLFPESLKKGGINRVSLGRLVFGNPAQLKKLEKILHPLVRQTERDFLKKARRDKAPAAILEIPLLFETGAEVRCDVTFCVTASKTVQQARVLRRKGMTKARLAAILKRQMPDREKRRLADYVIRTDISRAATKRQVREILERLEVRGWRLEAGE